MSRWNISAALERLVMDRDRHSVYCGLDFSLPAPSRGTRPSWEHILNDERIVTEQNIARCCISCNASKGAKPLEVWLASSYCQRKGITRHSVAAVVQLALLHPPTCI